MRIQGGKTAWQVFFFLVAAAISGHLSHPLMNTAFPKTKHKKKHAAGSSYDAHKTRAVRNSIVRSSNKLCSCFSRHCLDRYSLLLYYTVLV